MKTLVQPQRLQKGDTVATISLSWGGAGDLPIRYQAGKNQLEEQFGLKVVETTHALQSAQWIYEHPEARAADLMEAFQNPEIKAIFSTIGGEESMRLLKYIDFDIIRQNPKIFLGFSDTTVTHFMCLKAGLSSFYGTSVLVGFAENGGMHAYQIEDIKRTLFSTAPIGELKPNKAGWTTEFLDWFDPSLQPIKRTLTPSEGWDFARGKGKVQGPLIGGCMEVLELIKGTILWPEFEVWKGAILFLETSEEKPAPFFIRHWLRGYAAMGILEVIHGLIIGRPYDNLYAAEYKQAILQVLDEEGLGGLPVIMQMDFGHTCPTFTLPYGRLAEIDMEAKRFAILEAGVQ
ncbi:S66 peptidase family protein [Myroides odoratus]|uniref:S66 family peptidase n=1 Tax=Myroides odoratus TaxID=256 RepID=UPI00334136C3